MHLPDAPLHKRTVESDLAEVPAEPAVSMAEAAAEEAEPVEFLPRRWNRPKSPSISQAIPKTSPQSRPCSTTTKTATSRR